MAQNLNQQIPKVRYAVFSTIMPLAGGVMACAGYTVGRWGAAAGSVVYPGLGFATGLLTLLTIVPMYWIGVKRTGAVTSLIVVEYPWFCLLWILWIASAASAASAASVLDGISNNLAESLHPVTAALAALAFIGWLIIMGYSIYLAVYVVKARLATGSNEVWLSSVDTYDWDAALGGGAAGKGVKTEGVVVTPVITTAPQFPDQYPPQHPQYQPQYQHQHQQPQYQTPQPQYHPQQQAYQIA
ncbi:hypothetical protein FA15DRAFT_674228 [Coprinopsis marcescibilis]|uniref:MARVEL domain-containing protein n=1 Tax=Coprinopsis marcescibilis TaxID=230819 RepID=A0A5C3KHQ5_COPMA|nr:hypothetical protein FA15DRAFT_674228 [Coprinopsis marcescibilis]